MTVLLDNPVLYSSEEMDIIVSPLFICFPWKNLALLFTANNMSSKTILTDGF